MIVLDVAPFAARASSALVIVNVMTLPAMAQVPRIVPATPCESVLLMKPRSRSWARNPPSLRNEIDSFMSPTLPCQAPTIAVA